MKKKIKQIKIMKFKVFVDTNVLINDFLYRVRNVETGKKSSIVLQFIRQKKHDTFIASFSILQLISTFQTQRNRVDIDVLQTEINRIISHHNIIELTEQDIINGVFRENATDLEDSVQYELSQKLKCNFILTNNRKDFVNFLNVIVATPKKWKLYFDV